jgi:streptogramin lyase
MAPHLRSHRAFARLRALCATFLLLAATSALLSACDQKQDRVDGFSVFPLSGGHGRTCAIASGPDGNPWFTYFDKGQIARMTPTGALTVYSPPNQYAGPCSLITGLDGALSFTDTEGAFIGRRAL